MVRGAGITEGPIPVCPARRSWHVCPYHTQVCKDWRAFIHALLRGSTAASQPIDPLPADMESLSLQDCYRILMHAEPQQTLPSAEARRVLASPFAPTADDVGLATHGGGADPHGAPDDAEGGGGGGPPPPKVAALVYPGTDVALESYMYDSLVGGRFPVFSGPSAWHYAPADYLEEVLGHAGTCVLTNPEVAPPHPSATPSTQLFTTAHLRVREKGGNGTENSVAS